MVLSSRDRFVFLRLNKCLDRNLFLRTRCWILSADLSYRGGDVHEVDLSVGFVLLFGKVKGELVVCHQVICNIVIIY